MDLKKFFDNSSIKVCHLVIIVLFWSLLWPLYGDQTLPPSGHLFNLFSLFIFSCICAQIVSFCKCPPLLGSLVFGFIYSNFFGIQLNTQLTAILRSTGLVIISLLAGLELDPKVVRKMSLVCLRMAVIPCVVEVLAVVVVSYFLMDFPLKWGFLLGFVLAAASPAIVVPGMLALQKKQLGTDKGIPTLIIAAASVDDILAITGFGVCLGQVFNTGDSLVWTVLKGPIEAVMGVVVATVIGIGLWYIPRENEAKLERVLLLLLLGMVSMFVSQGLDYETFGPLACIVLSFVVAIKWRTKDWDKPSVHTLRTLWDIFEPLLFALIGFEVRLSDLQSSEMGFAVLALIISLILRTIASMVVIIGANLNLKEKLYVAISWIPKATVQAAIGSVALDLAQQRDDPELKRLATIVLTISVLSIVITAPLGSLWIAVMGSRCLKKAVPVINDAVIQQNYGAVDIDLKTN